MGGDGQARRYEALDGLRGVAAGGVVAFHIGLGWFHGRLLPHAYLAVDFFFLLSGFVVAHAYADRMATGGLSAAGFLRRRAARLYPMLLAGSVIGAAALAMKLQQTGEHPGPVRLAVAMGLGLLVLPGPQVAMTLGAFCLNPPAWSLFYEALANGAWAAAARRLTRPLLIAVIVASFLALVAYAFRFGGLRVDHDAIPVTLWAGLPKVSFGFFFGVLLQGLEREGRLPDLRMSPLLAAGVLLLVFAVPAGRPLVDLLCVTVLFPALVIAGRRPPGPRLAVLCRGSGALSYPLYAVHGPVLVIASILSRAHGWGAVGAAGGAAATVVTALVVMGLGRWIKAWRGRDPSPSHRSSSDGPLPLPMGEGLRCAIVPLP